jgi:hypothetical protein
VADAGGLVIEILATKGFTAGSAPAKADLDAWIDSFKLPVTTVMDPPGTGTPTFNAIGPRETSYIVDLKTMKIVKRITGDTTGANSVTIMDGAIADILALLAK